VFVFAPQAAAAAACGYENIAFQATTDHVFFVV